jgi:hypothetical protein
MNFDYYNMKNHTAYCRGCRAGLAKDQAVLHTWTAATATCKGVDIFICDACQFEISEMILERHGSLAELGQKVLLTKLGK